MKKIDAIEIELGLPRRLTGEGLARQVAADMVTWSQLQREIESSSPPWDADADRRNQAEEGDDAW